MSPTVPETEVHDLLYQLGATANYTGFFYVSYAIMLCAERQERLLLVTKWLYPEVAKRYGTNWKAVERNIRTVISNIWEQDPSLLECLAGRPLAVKPRNAQFLAILSASLLAHHGLGGTITFTRENNNARVADQLIDEGSPKPAASENGIPLAEL